MQVIEVNHVVMHIEGSLHDVANHFRIGGNIYAQGILNRADRGQGVDRSTNPTCPLDKGPYISGVPALYNAFQTAHHRAGAIGICYYTVLYLNFDAQMPFDTGNGIYYYSICHDDVFMENL